jgi:hypothetical protein
VRPAVPHAGVNVANVGLSLAAVEAARAEYALDVQNLVLHEVVEKLLENRVDVGIRERYSLVSHGETSYSGFALVRADRVLMHPVCPSSIVIISRLE